MENIVVKLLNGATFLWLFGWALRAFLQIARGRSHSIYFVIIVHFIFCGIPPLLDIIFGIPLYPLRPGFFLSSRDPVVSIIYDFYVSAIPLVWWWLGRSKRYIKFRNSSRASLLDDLEKLKKNRRLLILLVSYFFLLAPVVAIVLSPNPLAYLNYGVVAQKLLTESDELDFHRVITNTSRLASLGAVGILIARKKIYLPEVLVATLFLGISFWVNGKRNIIAIAIIVIGYVLIRKGYLKGFRLVAFAVITSILFLSFSFAYQSQVRERNVDAIGAALAYEDFRISYGRDDVVKLALYSELNPQRMRILEYRSQTVLFAFAFFIPRSRWEEKPLPFSRYIVSAASLREPRNWHFGIPGGILSESIANFGFIGVVVGPLFLAWLCRTGDSVGSLYVSALTAINGCLFMANSPHSFFPFLFLWIFTVTRSRSKAKKLYLSGNPQ